MPVEVAPVAAESSELRLIDDELVFVLVVAEERSEFKDETELIDVWSRGNEMTPG